MGAAGREVSISLDGLRDKNLMQLRKLNTALFPVRYNDKYYADALASGEFTKLGLVQLLGFFSVRPSFSPFSCVEICVFLKYLLLVVMVSLVLQFEILSM